jgi:hypothetical protein
MKKIALITLLALVIMAGCLWVLSPGFQAKVRALDDVGKTLATSDCNQLPVVECGGRVFEAKHNIELIGRTADYMVAVGGNTKVFLEIAEIAAAAGDECPRLARVLDLAVVKRSESARVVALARTACELRSEDQLAAWRQEFDRLWSTAEYTSVEEGLTARGGE